MTPERWERVKALFDAAADAPDGERRRLLAEASAADPDLAAEAASLLRADSRVSGFLASAPGVLLDALRGEAGLAVPHRVGSYRLLREIGAGGMGTVHLAERDDETFQKRVAIKLVRPGLDHEELVRRFLTERQILADLDHPGIARLLDGGTTPEGRPYLVMEHVEGVPIDVHCRERHLDVRARIALFRRVCAAVGYAHQHLVVHRDLKPGNILVTPDGTPKLLDFGIAKLFQPGGAETVTGLTALTPGYGSPEQVLGRAVATTSDVYSLGVVLYELLAGRLPYRVEGRAPLELARAVCDEEPAPPSVAAREGGPGRALDADLDNIVLTALRKDPARRYASVERLDDDLRRYLEGLPVTARPDRLGYRLGKFVRRNRIGVLAALLVALSIAAGVAATLREARIADRRFREVHKLANSLIFELHDSIQGVTGATQARELLVKRALEYLATLAREAPDDAAIRRDLATAYERIGDIQGRPSIANLGQYDAALASYEESLRLRRLLLGARPGDEELTKGLASSQLRKGHVFSDRGRLKEALASFEEAARLLEPLHARHPKDPVVARDLGVVTMLAGDALGHPYRPSLGEPERALASYRKGYAIQSRLLADDPKSGEKRHFLASHAMRLAAAEGALGRPDEASRRFQEANGLLTGLAKEYPRVGSIRGDLAQLETSWAELLVGRDRARALALAADAEATVNELAANDPANAAAREDRASTALRVADLVASFDPERARRGYELALSLYAEILRASPGRARTVYPAARAHAGLARLVADPARQREERLAALALLDASREKGNEDRRAARLSGELREALRPGP